LKGISINRQLLNGVGSGVMELQSCYSSGSLLALPVFVQNYLSLKQKLQFLKTPWIYTVLLQVR